MRLKGRITNWQDERGFGFVEPAGKGERAFAHISAFTRKGRRPADGDIVTYEPGRDDKGRPQARKIAWSTGDVRNRRRYGGSLLALLFLAIIGVAAYIGRIPRFIPTIYAGLSLVVFLVYAWDKAAARSGRWRTKESTLHLLSFAGGWPGALVAQSSLRHKSRKTAFLVWFWITVFGNCAALAWLLVDPDRLPSITRIISG